MVTTSVTSEVMRTLSSELELELCVVLALDELEVDEVSSAEEEEEEEEEEDVEEATSTEDDGLDSMEDEDVTWALEDGWRDEDEISVEDEVEENAEEDTKELEDGDSEEEEKKDEEEEEEKEGEEEDDDVLVMDGVEEEEGWVVDELDWTKDEDDGPTPVSDDVPTEPPEEDEEVVLVDVSPSLPLPFPLLPPVVAIELGERSVVAPCPTTRDGEMRADMMNATKNFCESIFFRVIF